MTSPTQRTAPAVAVRRFRVQIRKGNGIRSIEFQRYASMEDAELAAKALRRYGIDARAVAPDELPLEMRKREQ